MKLSRLIAVFAAAVCFALPSRAEQLPPDGIQVVVHDTAITYGQVRDFTAPAVENAAIAEEAKRLNVPLSRIGATGGQTLRLGGAAPLALVVLSKAYESWLPAYMSRPQGANP